MMRTRVFKMVTAMILSSTLFLPVLADDLVELTAVVEDRIDVITQILQNKGMEKEHKDASILGSVEDLFDYTLMGRLSLGKTQWLSLEEEKKKTFTDLFVERIKRSYLEKMYLYTDEKVVVKQALQVKPSRIHVPSNIIGKNGPTEILYKFYKSKNEGWLIYDVEIAGVSVVQTYRAQFAEILKSSPFDELLNKLKRSEPL